MKTIKELKQNFESMEKDLLTDGYRQALKDVLGLIDELKFIPANTDVSPVVWAEELKKRITG